MEPQTKLPPIELDLREFAPKPPVRSFQAHLGADQGQSPTMAPGAGAESLAHAERIQRFRGRSMAREAWQIATYPWVDPMSWFILAGLMLLLPYIPILGSPLSLCLLMAYGFQAIERVSRGDLADYTPAIDNLDADLAYPLLLALSAGAVSLAPALLAGALASSSPAAFAKSPVMVLASLACLAWGVLYFPIALIVASEGKSCLDTLNPLHGVRLVASMGAVYWQTLALCLTIQAALAAVLFGCQWLHFPLLTRLAGSVLVSYAFLCICCTLGFAILKKAPEMGLE